MPLIKPFTSFAGKAMLIMTLLALMPLVGLRVGQDALMEWSAVVGVICYFISRALEKDGHMDRPYPPVVSGNALWKLLPLAVVVALLGFGLVTVSLPEGTGHALPRLTFGYQFPPVGAIAVFALVAVVEEIAWRGFFQRQLRQMSNPLAAVLGTSALFAVSYVVLGGGGAMMLDVVYLFGFSVVCGSVFGLTRNLWASVLVNFFVQLLGWLFVVT